MAVKTKRADCAKLLNQLSQNFGGKVGTWATEKRLDFGDNPDYIMSGLTQGQSYG